MLAMVSELRHLDEQTVKLYDAVLRKIDDRQTAEQLGRFRGDHERHAQELTRALTSRYDVPQQPTDEFRRYMEEQVTLIERSSGFDEIMQRLLLSEEAAAAEYAAAERLEMTDELSRLVHEFHADEVRHVAWVEQHTPVPAGVEGGGGWKPSRASGDDISCMTGSLTDDRNPDDFE